MAYKYPVIRKVLYPQEGVVADIFTDNGGGIQRGKVANTNGARGVEARLGIEYDGTLIGILGSRRSGHGQHRNHNAALLAEFEDEGLDFDALATGKDVAHRYRADIRHRHGVVKGLQFSVQVDNQVTILQTVLADDCAILCRASVKAKDILGADIVFHNDPLGCILHFGKGILIQGTSEANDRPINGLNHQLFGHGLSRFIQEHDRAPLAHIFERPADFKNQLTCCGIILLSLQLS